VTSQLTSSDDRLAAEVARRLAQIIVNDGWHVGQRLGTEPALLERLGVSRKSFREAVRILEQQDVVRAETGKNGGLVVKAPALDAVSAIIRNHIELTDVSFDEVHEANRILQHFTAALVMERMTPAHANDMRAAIAGPSRGLRTRDLESRRANAAVSAMLDVARNPALTALAHMLNRLTVDFAHQERYPQAIWNEVLEGSDKLLQKLVRQLCARDPESSATIDALYIHIRSVVARLEELDPHVWSTRSFLRGDYSSALAGVERSQKAALKLCYRLAAKIQRNGLMPGDRLGSENELIMEYGVSPSVVVEALRMLEFLGIVRVRRGRAAGAEVIAPNTSAVIDTAVLYLSYFAPLRQDLTALRSWIERNTLELAKTRLSHIQVAAVAKRALMLGDRPYPTREKIAACLQSIFALSGNRILTLLTAILARVDWDSGVAQNDAPFSISIGTAARVLQQALTAPDGAGVIQALTALVRELDAAARASDPSVSK
jgi:DNA-binding FadR family transcriptional regulator